VRRRPQWWNAWERWLWLTTAAFVSTNQAPAGLVVVMEINGRGESDDFDVFFRGVFAKTVAVAERITAERGSAEDAAVEALAKAHLRWRRVGGQPWREAWVYKVAVHEAIRRLPRPGPAVPVPAVADLAESVAVRQALTAALRRLPRRQCEAIVLRYLLDFSEAEVAAALGVSQGTVKTHLHRGVAALRGSLGPDLKGEHLAGTA
jgi:RNA polymerase sigma factor (sigma-70 family)